MKTFAALFVILAVSVFAFGHSNSGVDQVSMETIASQGAAEAPPVRLAGLRVWRTARPYSTPSAVIQIKCKSSGASCTSNAQCCSGKCCTDDFEICEGWGGKCT
jgi:hypothetical protein